MALVSIQKDLVSAARYKQGRRGGRGIEGANGAVRFVAVAVLRCSVSSVFKLLGRAVSGERARMFMYLPVLVVIVS